MPATKNVGIWDFIHDALYHAGKLGSTKEGLVNQLGGLVDGNPLRVIATSLSRAVEREEVCNINETFYLPEYVPAPPERKSGSNGRIAPFAEHRKGYALEVHVNPMTFKDCVGLKLQFEQGKFDVPIFGAIRIFVGNEAPEWSNQQQMYQRVQRIEITYRRVGEISVEKVDVSVNHVVVIAPQ